MKKNFVKIAVLLFAVVLLFGIAACGKNDADTSDPKDIEMVIEGWMNQPVPSDYTTNPYKKYIDETFDINFSLKNVATISDELTKRYASSSASRCSLSATTDIFLPNGNSYNSSLVSPFIFRISTK